MSAQPLRKLGPGPIDGRHRSKAWLEEHPRPTVKPRPASNPLCAGTFCRHAVGTAMCLAIGVIQPRQAGGCPRRET